MSFFSQPFWSYELWGNTTKEYLIAVIVFAAFLLVFGLFRHIILRHLEKLAKTTKTDIDDTLIRIVRTLRPPFYAFVAFYIGFRTLTTTPLIQKIVSIILIAWITYQVIIALSILIDYAFEKKLKGKKKEDATVIILLKKISKALLWVFGGLFLLSNLGVDVTSLIAGLGIGGIAVALALQNILGDLFSSFAIYFDKPFEVGDFIVIGDKKGTVEKIGIKTTRLRSTQGEEIIISNQELTNAQIQNFKRMEERRSVFGFGVVYEISSEKLQKIPGIVEKIIESTKLTRFDRVHFVSFDDSALSFEVSYYIQSSDYKTYRDTHQEILFKIKEVFEKEKIDMAYPTQTLYVNKS